MNDTTDTLLRKKKIARPFLYLSPSAQSVLLVTALLLSVQVLMLAATKSYGALIVIASSIAGFFTADLLYAKRIARCRLSPLADVVQGIVAGMLLPSTFSPVTVFCIALCTVLLLKYLSGSFAADWVNSAVLIAAVAWIVGMSSFPETDLTRDILQIKNPSFVLIQNGVFPITGIDRAITETLNNTVFGFVNISIPDGYISLLWDTHSVIPAFRFNVLTLLSSIVLFAWGMQGLLVPSCFVIVYALLVRFAGPAIAGGVAGQGDMILALCTGGTLFYTVFVVQQYGTLPLSKYGKILYGMLAGIFAFLIAGCGMSPAGMIFTLLCANVVSPLIQAAEDKRDAARLRAALAENRKGRAGR